MDVSVARAGWVGLAFLAGALPWAVWLGRLRGVDVRVVGDGNPGTVNAWRVGGWRLGLPVLALDVLKGAVPVAVARHDWGWQGGWLAAVALAPLLGHIFSPLLRGRGGKGLATSLGVWTALTGAEGPLAYGGGLTAGLLLRLRDGWKVACGLLTLLALLALRGGSLALLAVWLGTASLLLWGYRRDLRYPPWQRP